MTTQPPTQGEVECFSVIPEPARPARTLLIFRAALSRGGESALRAVRLAALERSPSDHPRPLSLIVFQSPSR
ncbi:hypothetical protein, partial [Amycolatopsis tucumanensis]|uniref:hypothetical protein n=1 Tax=Amycolatopsis tucumanensis TaxID=401106 RepID=UPI001F19EC06